MTRKRVTTKKSKEKIINTNKITIELILSSYGVPGRKKIGASVTVNGCMIELTGLIFNSIEDVYKELQKTKVSLKFSGQFIEALNKERNGGIDSIEYMDQQDQLRKFNLK